MSKIKNAILGVSIALIFVFFVAFGIKSFYKAPKYEDFCKNEKFYPRAVAIKEYPGCLETNCTYMAPPKSLEESCTTDKGYIAEEYDEKGCIKEYYCETCQRDFDKVREVYNRNVFIISGIIGIIVIVVGAIINLPSVGAGLLGGGVLTLLYGVMTYWGDLADWARFIILGIALIVLIYLGYKGFSVLGFGKKEQEVKKKKR